MNQCFKIKHGTNYDKKVKKHFTKKPLWKNVMVRVGALLDENVTQMAIHATELWVNTDEMNKVENKKLFNKDGKLKNNSKRAKEILENYKKIVSDEGLADFEDLRLINFTYGVMRLQGQKLESFVTSENDIFYKADFNLEDRAKGLVEPITEIEYEEKYLEELKKNQ
ncbi:hypothetical protein NV379_01940 [Paenibacillus sp. N1-5-1-14]|uniref:hypothetical protein n=1 Tax=Paenibacillus radicibacter TaxID=2972488 RepID=UPI002158BC7C|nr:hypothetical protein [Paenibacillus radicibacter]MCR8641406.1 hypothetical protein [Paenibacillus radicibacter]